MKLVAPISKIEEVLPTIEAGADELYCGVLPLEWYKKYTNVASINRTERMYSNLKNFDELKQVVKIAHSYNIPVSLALNAFYTKDQYLLLNSQMRKAIDSKVDALIVADIGLLLMLNEMDVDIDIHVSTCGTTFNSETAKFYQDFGATRIILPRHMKLQEINQLIQGIDSMETEVFILNGGCRYITGFCTFQHGIDEAKHRILWNIAEKLKLGYRVLNFLRRLPRRDLNFINKKIDFFGTIGACMLNYKISVISEESSNNQTVRLIKERISPSYFDLFYGIDTCGACALYELSKMKINNIKIVGRGYATTKKINDVKFLHSILEYLNRGCPSKEKFRSYVKGKYKKIYNIKCRELCYYSE